MCVEIPLTRGLVTLVDEADAEDLLQYKWYAAPGSRHTYYACRYGHSSTQIRMHRWLLDAPKGMYVDHKDGDGLNNRRANIRICTVGQNQANRRKFPTASGYKGVRQHSGPSGTFFATIGHDHRVIYLGTFKTAEEAAQAYDAAARELFGEFAHVNFGQEDTSLPVATEYRRLTGRAA